MIKTLFLTLLPMLTWATTPFEAFIAKYPGLIYQDLVMGSEIHSIGTDLCEPRYALLKPILDLYKRPFSFLDLGAAQGYFSFRTARDYPHSSCVMIEANHTAYYALHGDMLYDLCFANNDLKNITYLDKRMSLDDLCYLTQHEHFDIVIAFLVVHLMHDSLKEQAKIVETLLSLGDNLILEVANDVGVTHTSYVEFLSESLECQYLGEVKRHKDPASTSTGKLFWFKTKTFQQEAFPRTEIREETFIHLNGTYPNNNQEISA